VHREGTMQLKQVWVSCPCHWDGHCYTGLQDTMHFPTLQEELFCDGSNKSVSKDIHPIKKIEYQRILITEFH